MFRYDNTRYHKKLNLLNFPDHKHEVIEIMFCPQTPLMMYCRQLTIFWLVDKCFQLSKLPQHLGAVQKIRLVTD
ncbi:MAG: hypothetical protein O4861_09415 [Trichodesmium sp. St16_bin4-tuft]|nr:hypothetical protein [Trichodesmium sp. MAG_R01]MDE5069900.1 hypothetical protein [Trichodesmium sp. St4_bin8_1]MDE5072757.1 hypothetical protein [Trichodesmium sp. St5_bin8]MDE5078206.1 hypothetical protein [Trichodesmium sp. St2_bin6]MDE5090608.1 hypothetical protein [Trichodesmium sp. St18_bin3_1_1]MDE5098538.1 hypothetical protein [Trichodesmium sp. St16_bin4-tuft]MDE5103558.1 hypothetical protein [Trichodesmium sp. St19_bin2]